VSPESTCTRVFQCDLQLPTIELPPQIFLNKSRSARAGPAFRIRIEVVMKSGSKSSDATIGPRLAILVFRVLARLLSHYHYRSVLIIISAAYTIERGSSASISHEPLQATLPGKRQQVRVLSRQASNVTRSLCSPAHRATLLGIDSYKEACAYFFKLYFSPMPIFTGSRS
jgi:hypothetical protein